MWISCLLIGSIILNLLQIDYGSYAAVPVANMGYWQKVYPDSSQLRVPLSASSNAEPATQEGQNTLKGNELQGGSLGKVPYWGPGVTGFEAASPVYADRYDGAYPDPNVFVPPHPDEQWQVAPGYGPGHEVYKPVFSHVSHLEPVYSFDSGSRYKRGRVVFAQTRYIPGEPRYPFWPVYWRFAKNWRRPAKTPSPGGW